MPVAAESLVEVPVPGDVTVSYADRILTVKGPKGTLTRTFSHPRLEMELTGGNIISRCSLPRKKEKALVGTWASHAQNMITGVTEGFEYQMKIVYAHFPVKVTVDKKASILSVSNFMGEKSDRKAKILEGVNVKVDGDQVILTGINREHLGQSAANIERSTRIRGFDSRVFQDGIYITKKAIHGDNNG
jgi:large subunit ribosomal protein L6